MSHRRRCRAVPSVSWDVLIGLPLLAALACTPTAALAQPVPATNPVISQAATKPAPAARPVAPPAKKAPQPRGGSDGDIVARVDVASVSAQEVRDLVDALGPRERAALKQNPGALSQEVRAMLARRLVLQEIAARKWDQQPEMVEQVARARDNTLVEHYLRSVSTPPANFPSEDVVQKVYDANRNAFLVPRQYHLTQVFVAAPRGADKVAEDQAKKTVEDAARRLKAPGADFAAVANETGTRNGGDLGWLSENDILPEIRARVVEQAKSNVRGTVSDPIRLDDGWHIVKLIDTREPAMRTLADVRDALVQRIRNERAAALRRSYLTDLLKQHPPEINEMALSGLLGDRTSSSAR
jgi:parvulin-like peptidyl-prolyl isomerase